MKGGVGLPLFVVLWVCRATVVTSAGITCDLSNLRAEEENVLTFTATEVLTMTLFKLTVTDASGTTREGSDGPLAFEYTDSATYLWTPTMPGNIMISLQVQYVDVSGLFSAGVMLNGTVLNSISTSADGLIVSDTYKNVTVTLLAMATVSFNVFSNVSVQPSSLSFDSSQTGSVQLYSSQPGTARSRPDRNPTAVAKPNTKTRGEKRTF